MTPPLVLIVDDDSSIRTLIDITLSRLAGWRVISADRGRPAIDLAIENHPSVILMDLMMPEMDGVEASRILLEDPRTADIPIVLLTARSILGGEEPPWANVAIRGVIAKPFDPRTLAQQIVDMVDTPDVYIAEE